MNASTITPATGSILFVDQDIAMRQMMAMLLHFDQHQVVTIRSAEEALTLIGAQQVFDVVISSFILPGMNGMEFLRQVSVNQPETVRILMTGGFGNAVDVKNALNNGHISRLAIKPLCLGTLREQVSNDLKVARTCETAY